jgi:hypothetical protein
MPPIRETERDMQRLEAALKQLEAEYNMYFAGRLPKPPWETRNRVAAMVKQYDRAFIQNYGDRFRFSTLQSRYQAFIDLWDKGLRSREEGRGVGPFAQKPQEQKSERKKAEDQVMHTTAFKDPLKEMDKLHDLYNSLVEARRASGEEAVPFHKFADLVKTQVNKLTSQGHGEVAFRVAVKDGKVNLTARATKGQEQEGSD